MNVATEIDIEGLDRADVLVALYNASRPLGLGFLHFTPAPMQKAEARAMLDAGSDHFDYLKGRVMKISLKPGEKLLRVSLYDRDNGPGAAWAALSDLLAARGQPK